MDQNHVLSSNETLKLFDVYFKDYNSALRFHELTRKISITIIYENIYGESKGPFKKDKLTLV